MVILHGGWLSYIDAVLIPGIVIFVACVVSAVVLSKAWNIPLTSLLTEKA